MGSNVMEMTASDCIKKYILQSIGFKDTGATFEEAFDELEQGDDYRLEEACEEFHSSGEVNDILKDSCRYFEYRSRARWLSNQRVWVGWTEVYGGGKHAEPYSIEFIDDAYFVTHRQVKKIVDVFTVVSESQ